jgi:hypothetical protein
MPLRYASRASRYVAPAAAALVAGGLVLAARRRVQSGGPELVGPSARFLRAILDTLPDARAILKPPDPLWDRMLGGKVADVAGGPAWGYYQARLPQPDGTWKSGGTTCGIVAAYWAGRAGWPREWVNRLPSDPVPGAGFRPGWHITKVYEGARKAAEQRTVGVPWLYRIRAPSASSIAGAIGAWLGAGIGAAGIGAAGLELAPMELRIGDYYCVMHVDAEGRTVAGSEHVGGVVQRSAPASTGEATVTTADGGQTCGQDQCAHWNMRTLRTSGEMVMGGEVKRLVWVVRAG